LKSTTFVLLILLLSLAGAKAAQDRNETLLIGLFSRFDPVPWAGNGYASAVVTSPGFLAFRNRPEILYGRMQSDGFLDGDEAVAVRSKQFGFATESLHASDSLEMRRFTVAFSQMVRPGFAIGLSYTWHTSDDDDLDELSSWDAGFGWVPHRRLQLSGTGRNLLRTEYLGIETGRSYELGARSPLVRETLSVFAQARYFAGDSWDEIVPEGGVEYRPFDFLQLRGRADTGGRQALGVELIYGSSSIGFHYAFADGSEEASFAYVKLHGPDAPRGR
jgi:hypothetical protein